MFRKLLFFAAILFLLIPVSVVRGAEDQAEDLVRKIYKDHRPTKGASILDKKETLSKYFDREMTDLFLKDYACSKRTGEVCNLDYDPIYNTQEISDAEPKLQIKKLSSTKDTASFEVDFDNYGPVKLTYQLRKTESGWRVSDIVDEEGGSLKKALSQKID